MKNQLILDGLSWTKLTASNRCLRYGTREYSALLRGVPNDEDGVQWCKEEKITIHGIDFRKPTHCTIDVDNPVYGHWVVESNEPSCRTVWENFRDKVGLSRIKAHMGNHQPPWDNWREMCSTTPADYGGHHFDRPYSCYWISNFVLHGYSYTNA
ncbi:hypothetical protein ARMSODRAFT_945904 [Armillaria solidipes]|uniref:Uncharacterized protein n=1 Tax=Armillaria solidipes TaxID=1076256 RepID=A0A2H3AJN5_9AGAR|nr:hypothetical protein ARMSODRAFT_945904 [Armillaria solidipes]